MTSLKQMVGLITLYFILETAGHGQKIAERPGAVTDVLMPVRGDNSEHSEILFIMI